MPLAEALIITSADLAVQDAEMWALTVTVAFPPNSTVPPPAPHTRVVARLPDETLNASVAEN